MTGLLGGAVVALASFRKPPAILMRALQVSWVVASIGVVGIAATTRATLGVPYSVYFDIPLGHATLWRAAGLVVAYAGLLVAIRGAGRVRTAALAVLGGGAAVSVLGHSLVGHARSGPLAALQVANQWTHIVAAAVWIGGLVMVLIGSARREPGERARAIARFSTVAGVALVILGLSGIARTWTELGSWSDLVESTYGRWVIFKAELLIGLAILGARNRYRHVPRAHEDITPLRRTGIAEIAIAIVVFGAASILSGTEPGVHQPVAAPAPLPTFYEVMLEGGASASAFIDPERPGATELHVTFFGSDRRELDARAISVRIDGTAAAGARRLSRGHVVVPVMLEPGPIVVEATAVPKAGGKPFVARFEILVPRAKPA